MNRSLRTLLPLGVLACGCGGVEHLDRGAGFERERATVGPWVEEQKLLPSDGAAVDYFGSSIATDGDTALVGAWGHSGVVPRVGAVYAFSRDNSGFVARQMISPSDGAEDDGFGCGCRMKRRARGDGERLAWAIGLALLAWRRREEPR